MLKKFLFPVATITFALFLMLSINPGAEAEAAATISVQKPTGSEVIPETRDFATVKFADPWDMSSRMDMSYGQYINDIGRISWKNGVFSGVSTGSDANLHPLFPGYEGVLFWGRDGFIHRIDTSFFNRFSVRMYSNKRTAAQLYWFYNQRWNDFGVQSFEVKPGWHTYVVYLPANRRWSGNPIGLRFDPTYQTGVSLKIDWMRLYRHSRRTVEVAWRDAQPGGNVNIYLDMDRDPTNNNSELIATRASNGANRFYWNPSAFSPRSYYFYLKKPGQSGVYSGRVYINRLPLVNILDPDDKGGEDYATAVSGDPWDMNNRSDIGYTRDIKDINFANGVMSATTVNGDGFFHLRVPKPIDTDKYHRLTFRYRYGGPFDYGLGTMARFIWSSNEHNMPDYQTSNDIVTYPHWQTYTIDLKKASMDVRTTGWNGPMTVFRFDPLEVPSQWRFYVDYIRLTADDSANSSFRIKWRDARLKPRPTKVSLYYDTDNSGFNGSLIAAGLMQQPGKTNSYLWNTSKVPKGKYFVYIVANDGISAIKKYSSGPINIMR